MTRVWSQQQQQSGTLAGVKHKQGEHQADGKMICNIKCPFICSLINVRGTIIIMQFLITKLKFTVYRGIYSTSTKNS